MEEGGGGFRPGKKSAEKGGEVDYKNKAGTAWSHSFLNQKPWHPLSYPNQRRKWIAEQTHSQNERRAEEVAREYAQQQDFLRQTALLSKKEKEKLEMMQAVSFLYVKPPGYNAESAKAAEIADEKKKLEHSLDEGPSSMKTENEPSIGEKKKRAPKDVFGRALPTEEQFEVLKNAPKLDTGVAGRAKPFGVEIRNVKCLRCGNYGHQSGDRECPLKDAIMPNEESRLKRDDPLTAIQAQVDSSEPLKWELKQKPGMSPPHGGFDLDDPNQQIVADDIFDEYGGFLGETCIPELLTNFSSIKTRKKKSGKSKHHTRRSPSPHEERRDDEGSESSSGKEEKQKIKKRHKIKKQTPHEERRDDEGSESSSGKEEERKIKKRHKIKKQTPHEETRDDEGSESSSGKEEKRKIKKRHKIKKQKHSEPSPSESSDSDDRHRIRRNRPKHHHSSSSEGSDSDDRHRHRHHRPKHRRSSSSEASDSDDRHRRRRNRPKHRHSSSPEASDSDDRHRRRRNRPPKHRHSSSSEASDSDDRGSRRHHRHHHSHRHRHQR